MRVAFGAMGGEPNHAHRNFAPCHCLRQAGVKAPAAAVCRSLLIGFAGHLRLSCEPIVEVSPVSHSGVPPSPMDKNSTHIACVFRCFLPPPVFARPSISVAGRPMYRGCRRLRCTESKYIGFRPTSVHIKSVHVGSSIAKSPAQPARDQSFPVESRTHIPQAGETPFTSTIDEA